MLNRLAELATAIDPTRVSKEMSPTLFPAEPAPLLFEGADDATLGAWLADRVAEIEHNLGRVPSIAVFVDGDDKIDAVVDAAREPLRRRNVEIVGCKEGRVLGNAQEVRVFDVQHVKGLEFEGVFFVGVDRLAERTPDLFSRFLYVGVTRAASYLGIHTFGELPASLHVARPLLARGGWSQGTES